MASRTIHDIGERALIRRISRKLRYAATVRVGVGDDTAVLQGPGRTVWLFASDMLVEGVHFRKDQLPGRLIGWKALAANVSDIAAMAGRPLWAVVSIGLPPRTDVRFVDDLYRGLRACARRFNLSIVGGDTVRAPQVIVDVAILGSVRKEQLTLRSGARVGDRVFVTGKLGGSYLSGRHACFVPRLKEAHELIRRVRVHAMMDISDGLASDLWQMARESRVTIRIEAGKIPVALTARTLDHSLYDGEDFELLFTVAAQKAKSVPRFLGPCLVTPIGTVVHRGMGVEIRQMNGQISRLKRKGFSHF